MKKIIYAFVLSLIMCLLFVPISCVYADGTEIKIDSVTATGGGTAEVPVILSGNGGICGANITVAYDDRLRLEGIDRGSALSSLAMTKPGSLASNPFVLVWDGTEEDTSNGTMVVLTFAVPDAAGEYAVEVSYSSGDIVDGKLNPVNVVLTQGKITVTSGNSVSITLDEREYVLASDKDSDGIVLVSFYDERGSLVSVRIFRNANERIALTSLENAATAKLMLWSDTGILRPICGANTVRLGR